MSFITNYLSSFHVYFVPFWCIPGLHLKKIENCMGNSDADSDNPVLKEEQDAQVRFIVLLCSSVIIIM